MRLPPLEIIVVSPLGLGRRGRLRLPGVHSVLARVLAFSVLAPLASLVAMARLTSPSSGPMEQPQVEV